MQQFLVELYVARANCGAAAAEAERLSRAAADGRPVRVLRCIVVPEDETCLLLVEADSAESVREAARRAPLSVDRLVEAAAVPTMTDSEGAS